MQCASGKRHQSDEWAVRAGCAARWPCSHFEARPGQCSRTSVASRRSHRLPGPGKDREIVTGCVGPVRLIQQENAESAAAHNVGISASSRLGIAFLDADDSWLPDKMRRQLEGGGDADVGLIHARAGENREPLPSSLDFQQLWERNRICTSTVVIGRSTVNQAGPFDVDPMLVGAEDCDLWLASANWAGR